MLANTYTLRATVVAAQPTAPDIFLASRIGALRSAEHDGYVFDFHVESQAGNTFVATYSEDGYCRVTAEQVLTLGTPSAYVDLAVTGREEDREGMLDLLVRTTTSTSLP